MPKTRCEKGQFCQMSALTVYEFNMNQIQKQIQIFQFVMLKFHRWSTPFMKMSLINIPFINMPFINMRFTNIPFINMSFLNMPFINILCINMPIINMLMEISYMQKLNMFMKLSVINLENHREITLCWSTCQWLSLIRHYQI